MLMMVTYMAHANAPIQRAEHQHYTTFQIYVLPSTLPRHPLGFYCQQAHLQSNTSITARFPFSKSNSRPTYLPPTPTHPSPSPSSSKQGFTLRYLQIISSKLSASAAASLACFSPKLAKRFRSLENGYAAYRRGGYWWYVQESFRNSETQSPKDWALNAVDHDTAFALGVFSSQR
jgi:hypothetical protein